MDRFSWRSGLLAVTFVIQLALLIGMIAGAERTIDRGGIWKFRTAPVDPVDLFRGRYATLSFPVVWVPVVDGEVEKGDRVYALLEADDEGFARFSGVSVSRPSSPDHLEVVALGARPGRARVQLPYDRFYMDEERAPEVDRLMRRRLAPAWALVRVHEGKGVVVDLHVPEEPELEEFGASSLTVWPEGTPVPASLLEQLRKELGDWQLVDCRREKACVLAAVDLDDTIEEEFLVTTSQPLGGGRMFYASRMGGQSEGKGEGQGPDKGEGQGPDKGEGQGPDKGEGQGPDKGEGEAAWRLRAMQFTGGRLPRTSQELIEALDAAGARGQAPPRRWLRLGDVFLYEPS